MPARLSIVKQKPTLPAPKPPLVLKREHIDILLYLRDMGAERADLWEEEPVDELFKARPRLVALIPGHEEPWIEITTAGFAALAKVGH